MKEVDARGLSCPEPLMMTAQALKGASEPVKILALTERSAHQESPQPAEMALGTGMILPGTSYCLHAFSITCLFRFAIHKN